MSTDSNDTNVRKSFWSSRPGGRFWRRLGCATRVIAILVIVIAGGFVLAGLKSVGANEGCLYIRNGKIEASWATGLHWRFTPISEIACYRLSRVTYEASPQERGGGALYNDDPVAAQTSDGQQIDGVSFRLSFYIPKEMPGSDPSKYRDQNLRRIYAEGGARNDAEVVSSVVTFYARPGIRRLMHVHTSDELYYGDPAVFSQELEDSLRPIFADHGVLLEDVLISKPDFNDAFDQRIQSKLQAQADVEIERERGRQADQQNDTRIRTANIDATAAAINQASAGQQAISQANVNATVAAIDAQADGDRAITQANAEATAIALQIDAYGSTDAYLNAQQIESMRNWPVQVIGESDAVPIFQLSPIPTPTAP